MLFSQLLYIFQSEHYDWKRFIRFVYSHLNWFSLQKRGKIDWTLRAKLLMGISLSLFFIKILSILSHNYSYLTEFILIAIQIFVLPIYILVANMLIYPLLTYKKNKILKNAKQFIQNIRENKQKNNSTFLTIGITGSYGKTTIKTLLESIISEQYTVFLVPGNINTDLGIANYLLKNKEHVAKSDILLLEMGAFCIGEIKSICNFIQPDYSFLTAIGNQHLERFGSHENIKKAKFEIVEASTKKAFINISDKNIKEYLPEFQKNEQNSTQNTFDKNREIISVNTRILEDIKNINYLPEFTGLSFEYKYNSEYIRCETKLIADHIISSLYFCLHIANDLQLSSENITSGIKKLNYVPHRLEVIKNKQTGVTVIDDSYNGNFDGFVSGLKTLQRATGRKIVLTPGIVELGEDAKKIHENLANIYPDYIDILLVILNKNTQYMLDYLGTQNNNLKIITYKTVNEAHADLANILKKGDTILFQNDLSDNY